MMFVKASQFTAGRSIACVATGFESRVGIQPVRLRLIKRQALVMAGERGVLVAGKICLHDLRVKRFVWIGSKRYNPQLSFLSSVRLEVSS
jgi:hypothetical protein